MSSNNLTDHSKLGDRTMDVDRTDGTHTNRDRNLMVVVGDTYANAQHWAYELQVRLGLDFVPDAYPAKNPPRPSGITEMYVVGEISDYPPDFWRWEGFNSDLYKFSLLNQHDINRWPRP